MNIKRTKIIKGDSTNGISGRFGGAIALFEEYILKRAVHHFFCTLHLNELPLRKLITAVLGVSSLPNGMKGEVGAHLKDLSSRKSTLIPCDKFKAVPNSNFYFVPPSVVKDLSNDQKLLYKLCLSVMAGTFDPELRGVILPSINWARWLTLAILILYYYTTLVNPPENLKTVVEFIIRIYAPT